MKLLNADQKILLNELADSIRIESEVTKGKLSDMGIVALKNLFSDSTIHTALQNISQPGYIESLDYDLLCGLYDAIQSLYSGLSEIKQEIDIEVFFKEGYRIDIKSLQRKYKQRGLKEVVPDLNFEMLESLYCKPPSTIPCYYDPSKFIRPDPFVFRKYLVAIIQMIFDHMDLLVCSTGNEGSGKSLQISQDMLMCHWIMTQIGIISYEFDIKEMWFNTLQKFREAEDKYFDHPFRILGLDEGNELNRQDWKDDEVKTFFQRLRRERYNRRIKFISLPVLGEMVPNIVLSRMNFITDMKCYNELTTGTMHKGDYNFYIIPRGNTIYSPHLKKELTSLFIKNKLFENLKDKKYLKGMPSDIIIKKCKNNGLWGFKQEIYNKELKESNKTYTVNKGINFTMMESFMFYKANPSCKKLGIKPQDIRWDSVRRLIARNNKKWEEDIDSYNKYEAIFKRKIEERQEAAEC